MTIKINNKTTKKISNHSKVSDEIILKYWKENLNDSQIGKIVGLSSAGVGYRRRKLGLKHNDKTKYTINSSLTLSSHHAFIGHMLGDGNLNKRYLNGNARGLVFHGEKQKDYLEHKRKIFNNLNPSELRKHDKIWKDGKMSKGYEFYLPTNKYLTTLYDLLYINKKRTITEKYLEDYNEISLAYHFMDDGNYHKRTKSYTICLAGFDNDSVNIYKNFLETKFKLNITIQKNNNVYIKQQSKRDFEKLIRNYIPKCMSYKINTFYEAHDKQGELLEHQEIDNQQLSLSSNAFESSTTRGTVLTYNKEDDTSTSALPVIYTNGDDIV